MPAFPTPGRMSVGPSQGFWSKFGNAMPGALNALGQMAGPSYMQPMLKAAGGMLGNKKKSKSQPSQPPPVNTQPAPDVGYSTPENGIVRPYSPMSYGAGAGGGIADRMNLGMNFGLNQGIRPSMNMLQPNQGAGLWQAYSRLSGLGPAENTVPQRGMFY